ncbi:MAG TPA: hypothetical protein DEP05_03310 [Betaproteobacteria bacterium]|nr:hypothetical protein [Betaproteobacteria bacterium]
MNNRRRILKRAAVCNADAIGGLPACGALPSPRYRRRAIGGALGRRAPLRRVARSPRGVARRVAGDAGRGDYRKAGGEEARRAPAYSGARGRGMD